MRSIADAAVGQAPSAAHGGTARPSAGLASLQGVMLVLCLAYIISNLFYVLPSGNPQPSDFMMAIVIGSAVTGLAFKIRESQRLVVTISLMLFWIWQVNLAYYMFYSDTHFLWTNMYFLYNVGAFLAVHALFQHFGHTFARGLRATLLVALIVEVIAVIITSFYWAPQTAGLHRSVGTYEDPNQLAYWAILALCSLLVLKPEKRLGGIEIVAMAATIYIVISSLSRSGLLGLTIVLLVVLPGLRVKATWLGLLAGAAALAIVLSWANLRTLGAYAEESAPAQILVRFDETDRDDNLAGRGYERLWRFPEHLILGAGEGAYWRFRGGIAYEQTEFHSSLGNILFSYGIIGLGLVCSFLWEVFRRAPWQHKAYLLGPLAWGIFNYGFRFSMFWVFLAIVYSMATLRARSTG